MTIAARTDKPPQEVRDRLAGRKIAFGIGAQKAGTTWLFDVLRKHPQAYAPHFKEAHYWNYVQNGVVPGFQARETAAFNARLSGITGSILARFSGKYQRAAREYEQWARLFEGTDGAHGAYIELLLMHADDSQVIAEITPNYAELSTDTFASMAALAEDTRFFFVMRDPVSRTLSGLGMGLRDGWIGPDIATDLNSAIEAVLAGKARANIERSRYDATIERLEAAVPREQIHYMFYETMFEQAAIDGLMRFLGISGVPVDTSRKINAAPKTEAPVSARLLEQLRAALAPTYSYVTERFGDAVPSEWHRASEIPA